MLQIKQLAVLNDNYIYLLHDPLSGDTAVVDPALAEPVLALLENKGWQLTHILNTHHHHDHVGGNLQLKQKTGCKIYASAYDKNRIPGIDVSLNQGDTVKIGLQQAHIMATPGHTSGHIVYHFPEEHALFCGDTLFVMGCGRLFEGTAEHMWQSLNKLKQLPLASKIFCAHEYTQNNAQFALSIEPDNTQLKQILLWVNDQRARNLPTVPSTLKQELATNPFLRADCLSVKKSLNMLQGQSEVDVFAKIRALKDAF